MGGKAKNICVECLGDCAPDFAQIFFAVFWEEGGERGLFGESACFIVCRREWVDLPLDFT